MGAAARSFALCGHNVQKFAARVLPLLLRPSSHKARSDTSTLPARCAPQRANMPRKSSAHMPPGCAAKKAVYGRGVLALGVHLLHLVRAQRSPGQRCLRGQQGVQVIVPSGPRGHVLHAGRHRARLALKNAQSQHHVHLGAGRIAQSVRPFAEIHSVQHSAALAQAQATCLPSLRGYTPSSRASSTRNRGAGLPAPKWRQLFQACHGLAAQRRKLHARVHLNGRRAAGTGLLLRGPRVDGAAQRQGFLFFTERPAACACRRAPAAARTPQWRRTAKRPARCGPSPCPRPPRPRQ